MEPIFYYDADGTKKNIFDIVDASDFYVVSGERGARIPILKHTGVQKLARAEKIRQVDIMQLIQPSSDNMQQHGIAVRIRNARGEDLVKTGEASRLNTGKWGKDKEGKAVYLEKENIDSKYRLAMAEKRAFDRAVLEELQLYDIRSSVESPDFEEPKNAESLTSTDFTDEQKKEASASFKY